MGKLKVLHKWGLSFLLTLGIGIQSLTVILKTNTLSHAMLLSLRELIYIES